MKKVRILIIFIFGLSNLCFGAEESITITAYYPSPYGSYNELTTNKLAVGDTNGNGTLDAADQPNRNGDIRLKAQTGDPATWPAGTTGQLAYSSTQDSLYHYNGSSWVASGGGSTCYVDYSSAVGSCSCPIGWRLKKDLGSWGNCYSGSNHFFRPPDGGCFGYWNSYSIGEGCLCCQ
ncbi:MAG: hypothetical protein PHO40_06730 [Candidatus Omnitrophica bacterium]|jgi:hypothetical protein|nr:hypothetical protein [Candidatus Omnitrophota bacterium]